MDGVFRTQLEPALLWVLRPNIIKVSIYSGFWAKGCNSFMIIYYNFWCMFYFVWAPNLTWWSSTDRNCRLIDNWRQLCVWLIFIILNWCAVMAINDLFRFVFRILRWVALGHREGEVSSLKLHPELLWWVKLTTEILRTIWARYWIEILTVRLYCLAVLVGCRVTSCSSPSISLRQKLFSFLYGGCQFAWLSSSIGDAHWITYVSLLTFCIPHKHCGSFIVKNDHPKVLRFIKLFHIWSVRKPFWRACVVSWPSWALANINIKSFLKGCTQCTL